MGLSTPRERLEQVLHIRDMSKREFAKRVGISPSHLTGYLSGAADRMTFEMWIKIAETFKLSLNWLAGLPEKEKEALTPEEEELLRLWRQVKLDLIKETTFSTLRAAIAL